MEIYKSFVWCWKSEWPTSCNNSFKLCCLKTISWYCMIAYVSDGQTESYACYVLCSAEDYIDLQLLSACRSHSHSLSLRIISLCYLGSISFLYFVWLLFYYIVSQVPTTNYLNFPLYCYYICFFNVITFTKLNSKEKSINVLLLLLMSCIYLCILKHTYVLHSALFYFCW